MEKAKSLVKVMYEEVSDLKDVANDLLQAGDNEGAQKTLKFADQRLEKAIELEKSILDEERRQEERELKRTEAGKIFEKEEREAELEKEKQKKENIFKWVGLGVTLAGTVTGAVVAIVVNKNNNNALTNVVAQSWQAQTTGEVPAALTKELTSQVIRECGKAAVRK